MRILSCGRVKINALNHTVKSLSNRGRNCHLVIRADSGPPCCGPLFLTGFVFTFDTAAVLPNLKISR
jgi:hypothetical protein